MEFNVEGLKNKLKETRVLFFDLDGTIIDTEHLYFRFWSEACRFCGHQMSEIEALNMRSLNKESAIEYLSKISNNKLDYYLVKQKRIELMDEYLKTHPITFKEGALEILTKFKKENKKIYIVTANTADKASKIINDLGFMHLIDEVVSAKDVKRGKPFPDVYLKACEIVNAKPNEVVVFEDSPNGLLASFKAGCYTVMVEDMSPYEEKMDYVDAAIKSFKSLI